MLLTAAMVLLASTAAVADSQTQRINLGVFPADTLAIQVEDRVDWGIEVGQSSDWRGFWIQVLNTTDDDWMINAASDGLVEVTCDGEGVDCNDPNNWTPVDGGQTIGPDNIRIRGYSQPDWGDDPYLVFGNDGGVTLPSDGSTSDPFMWGESEVQGNFGFSQNPEIQLSVPNEPALANLAFAGDVVYTLMPGTYTP